MDDRRRGLGGVAGGMPRSADGSGKLGIAATVAGTMAGLFPGGGISASLDNLYAARTRQAALEAPSKQDALARAQSQYRQRGRDSANPHLQIDRLNLLQVNT